MTMTFGTLVEFLRIIGKLKFVKRSGWISQVGIDKPESVAGHSFRCAILAMCISDLINLDTEKLIRMLLLHDTQEAISGDYDSHAKKRIGISKVKAQERIAIRDILSKLPAQLGKRYLTLWEEFENQKTYEAILANDIDKIEMTMQALEYEKEGYSPDKLETFWKYAQDSIKNPLISDFFELLKNEKSGKKG